MMTRNLDNNRDQMTFVCLDEMVPLDHILRSIDRAIDWNFIYDMRRCTLHRLKLHPA